MYYSIDRYGCVHFGTTPVEAARKAREASQPSGGPLIPGLEKQLWEKNYGILKVPVEKSEPRRDNE